MRRNNRSVANFANTIAVAAVATALTGLNLVLPTILMAMLIDSGVISLSMAIPKIMGIVIGGLLGLAAVMGVIWDFVNKSHLANQALSQGEIQPLVHPEPRSSPQADVVDAARIAAEAEAVRIRAAAFEAARVRAAEAEGEAEAEATRIAAEREAGAAIGAAHGSGSGNNAEAGAGAGPR